MATSRDVQDVVSKLASEKSKNREEGLRLLNNWMEGDRAVSFCRFLTRNTAKLRHDEIPHSETWPFILNLLMKCISLEITASKRRHPKPFLAKTLRDVIQHAEDLKFSGRRLVLLAAVKSIFNHLWEVIKDVPSFQAEYSSILRQLLQIKEYHMQMRKKVYQNFVVFYIHKTESIMSGMENKSSTSKEDAFRCVQTLHSLLECPVGDIPENLRSEIVKGVINISSNLREEGKVSRKLVECINTYFLKDGPNIGRRSLEIHLALQDFISSFWLSTHDHGLKTALILYAKIQLKLGRTIDDLSPLISLFLELLSKEFDQSCLPGNNISWTIDTDKDVRTSNPTFLEKNLMELAAAIFQKACIHTIKTPSIAKRRKKDDCTHQIKEGILSGKWLWNGSFCYLIRYYHHQVPPTLIIEWFQGIADNFERFLSDGISSCNYDGPLWVIRSLQELASLVLVPKSEESCVTCIFDSNQLRDSWHKIWTSLIHWLPIFSNVTQLVDDTLKLLGLIFSHGQSQLGLLVPHDVWDLQIFKRCPSVSALYFITCYFSHSGYEGNSRDTLLLRESLLRGIYNLLNLKDGFLLNKQNVWLIPSAMFSLCAGYELFVFPTEDLPLSRDGSHHVFLDDWMQQVAHQQQYINELNSLECSVEMLADLKLTSSVKTPINQQRSSWIPLSVRRKLLQEMEDSVLKRLNMYPHDRELLSSELFLLSTLLSNVVYGSLIVRQGGNSSFVEDMLQHLQGLLTRVFSIVDKSCRQNSADSPPIALVDGTTLTVETLKTLARVPLFFISREKASYKIQTLNAVESLAEVLLNGLEKFFDVFNGNEKSEEHMLESNQGSSMNIQKFHGQMQIVDIELDTANDAKDRDLFASTSTCLSKYSCFVQWKTEMLLLMSNMVMVLPEHTWDIMTGILEKEIDSKVRSDVLCHLCKAVPYSPTRSAADMVDLLHGSLELCEEPTLAPFNTLVAIHALLQSLLSSYQRSSDRLCHEQKYTTLGDLLIKVIEVGFFDWQHRIKLIDCICCFIRLDASAAEGMVDKLFAMLQDSDFRVRVFLAKQVGLLFQTWDGHEQLFEDICCSFGTKFPMALKEMVIMEKDVLNAGDQSEPMIETTIVTVGHLAFFSDKIEAEALFILCSIAAMSALLRELISAILDNLSRSLHYESRFKYLEANIGPILFRWVTCGVALTALVEVFMQMAPTFSKDLQDPPRLLHGLVHVCTRASIRGLFLPNPEPDSFLRFCCPWLIPALILQDNNAALNWISLVLIMTSLASGVPQFPQERQHSTHVDILTQVMSESLATVARLYFVPIYSFCIALYCSNNCDKHKGEMVLCGSILRIAELTQQERDQLIKKHMIAIVGSILSLCSAAPNPVIPYFSKATIMVAVQTTVDGFLEMENLPKDVGVVDKIHVFRSDRTFKFLLEIHYQLNFATLPRYKCHVLARIEVLIMVIHYRATSASTSCYLFSLICQCVEFPALQEQCCHLLNLIFENFMKNVSSDSTSILGEQLQFLVSKLVACCIPPQQSGDCTRVHSSTVLALLHKLIVDSDPSLHCYIRELEPFPEIDCFSKIRNFHQNLQTTCSVADQFVKFVGRINDLPPPVCLWSLKALHVKLVKGEFVQTGMQTENFQTEPNYWCTDPSVVSALWALVSISSSDTAKDIRHMVADFLSQVGVGDPYCATFKFPGHSTKPCDLNFGYSGPKSFAFISPVGVSEKGLTALIMLLKKYLLDSSVTIVEVASRALQGILSTESGQHALLLADAYNQSLLEVHSKGVDLNYVTQLLSDVEASSKLEAISLHESSLWQTTGKSFETWICPLTYSLIHHTKDITLRLCQSLVVLKAEVAEFLFSDVLVCLSMRYDPGSDLCQLISSQVQKHIFVESNCMTKSIQVMLDAMNKLRLFCVMESAGMSPFEGKKENSKGSKVSCGRSRSPFQYENQSCAELRTISCSSWKKVYWLTVDYLSVAKSAILCGSFFSAVLYVELWCEDHFQSLTLGNPDFSLFETLPAHVELLVSAVTKINEPDSIYGIIQSHKLPARITMYEHEGNWSTALESYDLLIRTSQMKHGDASLLKCTSSSLGTQELTPHQARSGTRCLETFKGLMRSLQQTGCTHVLDLYYQGMMSISDPLVQDEEFIELQYEAAWRAGNWDFCLLSSEGSQRQITIRNNHFHKNLHGCLRALQEGDADQFQIGILKSKQELLMSISYSSKESTGNINSSIIKLQMLDHLINAWMLRWMPLSNGNKCSISVPKLSVEPLIPDQSQFEWLNKHWECIIKKTQFHLGLLEPFIAFRRMVLQILNCRHCTMQHLVQSASIFRKGGRFSLATASLQEFKISSVEEDPCDNNIAMLSLGRLEEAKLLRAQGQLDFAINLARYILDHYPLKEEICDLFRLTGKWLAEARSTNSRTILEQYLNKAVELSGIHISAEKKSMSRQCQANFQLAHYCDTQFRRCEERLCSNEWQATMKLRRYKAKELEALLKRLKSTTKGEKIEYSVKIQELQKQLAMDTEEANKLKDDRDNFLSLALDAYKRCLVVGAKYDLRVVFRLVSLWFSLSSDKRVIRLMIDAVKEVQSFKFVPLVYQIASRMSTLKEGNGVPTFQFAVISLVKKMAIDHPYHTILQLLALANGDRVKDKQRNKNSFVINLEKKLAAENLLNELAFHHRTAIAQMKQMVEMYIRLAELETKKEDTNKRIPVPRDIRSLRQLELVPVVTATIPVDHTCEYREGSFPHFKGLADSIMIMNGINAPKVVECLGSDGRQYRQLAKSGNDDLRQDAVMEQFFGLVNSFLLNHRDTCRRKLRIRTYKVVPFTPSAGVLEWVDGTIPLGEYLLGSMRNGGAHKRYGRGDWSFLQCREHMTNEKDKRKAFHKICENFRPVLHYFFLERFLQPSDWFEKRLSYARSVAASSMVGYIVGLGDRHSMNVLLDQSTAEVVHIDLGVAFEQGLMLKTPERVPFRLTRDIIDGMGVTGVEGVFRRCCEKTLSVMRTNQEALLTIVEVFIHDPLYKWALSPLKALQRQKETDDDVETSFEDSDDEYEGNKDAARALIRVKQKLDGYEEGEMRSVQGQVQQLIQNAVDTDRLSHMFPGWGAWL